jgi:hypothetical protein
VGFYMHLFGKAGEPVAQHARTLLIAEIVARDPRAIPTVSGDGIAWACFGLTSDRDPSDTLDPLLLDLLPPDEPLDHFLDLQIYTDAQGVRESAQALRDPGDPDLSWCDIHVEIRLGGRVTDWTLVRAVWAAAAALWSAVGYVDGSGFGLTIDDLPE